ncbi:MAG: TonB-dependent receptor plug domain-containing protein, partial [Syntrophothermus sp.]
YQKKIIQNVKVNSDFTTSLDIQLNTETLNLETVVIQATNPLIRKDLTSSKTVVDVSTIESLPVESIDQILSLQAGIVKGVGGELHIRGGRSTEVDYTINGVSVSNPFDNSRTVTISTNAIQELSVVSGTFNAEYGNALSGVVNTITKEGSQSYKGYLSFYTGDYLSAHENIFFNIDDVNPINNSVTEGTFSGPVPFLEEYSTFFLSARYNKDNGYLYGKRQNTIYDSVWKSMTNPNDIRISSTGDNKIVSMNGGEDLNATGKLTFKPLQELKINYDVVYSKGQYKSYNHDFKYNPDGVPTSHEWGLLNSLELRHTIGLNTFYSLKGSFNIYDYKRYLFPLMDANGNPVDYHPGMNVNDYYINSAYQPSHKINTTVANYTFLSGGTSNNQYYQRAYTSEVKLDLTSQLDNNHELKFGLQGKVHEMNFETFDILRDTTLYLVPTILDANTSTHDLYTRRPLQLSGYIQDKMEFESIVLNIGVRYDLFNSKSVYGPDINNPSKNLVNADIKHRVSPRIGISFPITDRGIIHFSYGHFYQVPPFSYLYANPNFEAISGSPTFGNANLNPEKTVTYEMGLQQQLAEDLAFNVTGFYKDVRDLLASQQIRINTSTTYFTYVNKDYGNIKGITFSLTKRRNPNDLFGATLDYTYQVAEGNDLNSDAFFLDISSGRQSEKIPVSLAWDQTHTLNGTVSVGSARDWNVTVVGRLGTGLPYTPQITTSQIFLKSNSSRRPSQTTIDLLAEKAFTFYGFDLTLFLKIFNLFDTLNERIVYNDTGRSTYTLEETKGNAQETNRLAGIIPGAHSATEYFVRPNYYLPPREVRVGMSIDF